MVRASDSDMVTAGLWLLALLGWLLESIRASRFLQLSFCDIECLPAGRCENKERRVFIARAQNRKQRSQNRLTRYVNVLGRRFVVEERP